MEWELAEVLEDPKAIVVVEWGGIAEAVLPANRLAIRITPTSETARRFNFSCPNQLSYLAPVNT